MKKNEQLFDILGDIPDNLIEDALNSNVIKVKSFNWKSLVSVAAVFAVILSVPAGYIFINKNAGNENINPGTTVSDVGREYVTASDTIVNNENKEEKSDVQGNVLSFGTGPERAENYSPDKKYSYCDIKNFDFYNADNPEVGYTENVLNTILLNQNLAEKIISDVHNESEKFAKENGISADNGYIFYDITEIINGYASISIGAYTDSGIKTTRLIYDIIEGRKLENESDLFYYGEDYITEIDKCISERLRIDDFTVDNSKPYKLDVNSIIINGAYGGTDDISAPHYFSFDEMPLMYDIAVTGKYRDMSGIVKDEYLSDQEMNEWYGASEIININGYDVNCQVFHSRFHSEEEISAENAQLIDSYKKALSYILSTGLKLESSENSLIDMSLYDLNEKVFCINVIADNYFAPYFCEKDGSSVRIINGDILCPEWKKYIDSYYENPYKGEYNPLDKSIEEDSVNLDDYKLISWEWKNDYYIPADDDEIKNLDKAAFVYNLYNPETEENISALVLIPLDEIYDVYFDAKFGKEGYANCVRQWDK